jgi:hypothetical protein
MIFLMIYYTLHRCMCMYISQTRKTLQTPITFLLSAIQIEQVAELSGFYSTNVILKINSCTERLYNICNFDFGIFVTNI